jgi:hypothetical protein
MIMSAGDIALTAPNQAVEARNGVSYAYRWFGAPSPGVLLFQWPEQFAELVHSFLSGAGEERAA